MSRYSNNIIDSVILAVCAIFILAGSVNNGFSGFLFAIPFLLVYIIKLKKFEQPMRIYLIVVLSFMLSPIFIGQSDSKLFYPYIGSHVTFNAGWGYVQFKGEETYTIIEPASLKFYMSEAIGRYYSKPLKVMDKPNTMTMVRMNVSHADFGTFLRPVFQDKSGNLYSIGEDKLMKGIRVKNIMSDDLMGTEDLQSEWTKKLGMLMMWPMFPIILLVRIPNLVHSLL